MKDERVSIYDIIHVFEQTNSLMSSTTSTGSFSEDDDSSSFRLSRIEEDEDEELLVDIRADDYGPTTPRSENSTPVSTGDGKSPPVNNVICNTSANINTAKLNVDLHNMSDEKRMLEILEEIESKSETPINYKKDYLEPKRKGTLLHTAARLDFLTVMQHLLDYQPDLLESKDKTGATPIFYACGSAHSKATTMLAINGAQLNIQDKYESSPLSVSLNSKNKLKGYTVSRTLLGFHVDVEFKVYCGNTILHLACREGDLEKVQFIVEDLKHNIFRKNTKQESCLFRAVKHENVCKYLLDYCEKEIGHDRLLKLISMTNDQGRTVFHHCCAKGYLQSFIHILNSLKEDKDRVEMLVNERDTAYGFSPLHICVLNENSDEIFAILLRSKEVKLDIQNLSGDTPLHIALRNEKIEMVKELYHLYSSKSLNLKNNQRKTIDKLAKEHDIDLKKLEKELEKENAGIEKEGFWGSLFKSKKVKKNTSTLTKEAENRMSMATIAAKRKSQLGIGTDSWDPQKYFLGHEMIDQEHSQLIAWLKNLSEAALTSQSHWVVGYVIGCCAEYTDFHFKDEEQVMLKYRKGLGEEYVKKHLEEHETFTTKIKQVHKEYIRNHSASLDIELLKYLVNWLLKHINFTDRHLVQYVNSHKPDDEISQCTK
ncbi:hypothetical protein ABK040_002300 [Willaertia magna]